MCYKNHGFYVKIIPPTLIVVARISLTLSYFNFLNVLSENQSL